MLTRLVFLNFVMHSKSGIRTNHRARVVEVLAEELPTLQAGVLLVMQRQAT